MHLQWSHANTIWENRMRRFIHYTSCLTFLVLFASVASAQRPKNAAFAEVKDAENLPRVLLIGDSISIGYTVPVREALKGKANVHRAPTNCGPTTRGLAQIDSWLGDGKWDVIHFNWGLHDLKFIDGKRQVPLDEYEKNLHTLTKRLKETGATLIWCSTTPYPADVSPKRIPEDAVKYNEAAARVMKEFEVETDDLYTFALDKLDDIQQPSNVHFTPSGSKVLGQQVSRQIEMRLK